MATHNTLAVLITYHNEGELLTECLESIVNQLEISDEVVVYDDASQVAAKSYVPAGLPVKIIHGEINRGPAYGRNVLLHACQSDYIHFHDADDLFKPNWCECVREVIQETEADALFTEIATYRENEMVCERVLGLERLLSGEDLVRFCLQGAMLVPAGTYRRAAVCAIGGYRETLWLSEDFDFHVRLAVSGVRHSMITTPLVIQRLRPSSHSHSQSQFQVWSAAVGAIEKLASEIPSQYKIDLADAAARAGSTLFGLGAFVQARAAFKLADRLGPPALLNQKRLYRMLARTLGIETAEEVGAWYRKVIPEKLRRSVGRLGSLSRLS